MTNPIVRRAARVASVLALAALTAVAPPSASAAETALGFDEEALPAELPPVVADSIGRAVQWRAVDLDVAALQAELASTSVNLELFDDVTLRLGPGAMTGSAGDGYVWSARRGLDSAMLTIDGDRVRGSLMVDGRTFSITPTGGRHVIVEEGDVAADVGEPIPVPDDLSLLPTADVVREARELIASGAAEQPARTARADSHGNQVIRVMTVYTYGARVQYGSDEGAQEAIEGFIDDANVVLANSEIPARLESVLITAVDHQDAPNIEGDLEALTFPQTDPLREVHVNRELLEADVVMMVRAPAGNTCGLAWLLEQPSSALDDEFAMGVVDTVCAPATGQYAYIHEVGHILGAGHGNSAGDGVFSYSAGFNSGTYRTIMAYENGCGCSRVPYFSAPRSVAGIGPIGSATQDNSRTLSETAGVVSNFRPFPLLPTLPTRLLDTREGKPTVDGRFAGWGRREAGSVQELTVAGRGEVPNQALSSAVMLNVTAVLPDAAGHITVWPCDADQPTASNLNYVPGQVVPNSVLAELDPQGRVCIYTKASTHLVVDVTAYVPVGASLDTIVPARYLETRSGPNHQTFDDDFEGIGMRAADSTLQLQIAGRGDVPLGTDAVMLNVTAVLPKAAGHITVWPCDADQPTASSLNYVPGQVVPNAVLAKLDPQGRVCIYTRAATHLVVDVNGAIAAGSRILTVTPARLLETRTGPDNTTVDGIAQRTGPLGPDAWDALPVVVGSPPSGRGGVTPGALAAIVNVTVVAPDRPGHITLWPCTDDIPTASNLNYVPGQVVANMAIAEFAFWQDLDFEGPCVYTVGRTDLVVDVVAYF